MNAGPTVIEAMAEMVAARVATSPVLIDPGVLDVAPHMANALVGHETAKVPVGDVMNAGTGKTFSLALRVPIPIVRAFAKTE